LNEIRLRKEARAKAKVKENNHKPEVKESSQQTKIREQATQRQVEALKNKLKSKSEL